MASIKFDADNASSTGAKMDPTLDEIQTTLMVSIIKYLGGLLLAAADLLARLVIAPAELPVGVLTALLGGGYLLWLMRRAHGAGAMQ